MDVYNIITFTALIFLFLKVEYIYCSLKSILISNERVNDGNVYKPVYDVSANSSDLSGQEYEYLKVDY